MSQPARAKGEERIELFLGNLLRVGVLLAAVVVLLGAIIYLVRRGGETTDYTTFHGQPPQYRRPALIVAAALSSSGRAIIQVGLLLLIATPVARVVFSALAFAWQRDYTYVALTLGVLGVLLYSLLFEV